MNRRGQVLLATVNEATIIPFVSGQVSIFSFLSYVLYVVVDAFPEMFDVSMILKDNLLSQLNNLELAVNLAKRGNLPGAENLVSGNLVSLCAIF